MQLELRMGYAISLLRKKLFITSHGLSLAEVERFSMIAIPMTRLLQKELKALWTEASILVQPELGKEFLNYSNTSLKGLDFVLMHKGKVIAYTSRQLKII
ncbi:Transposon Ty3-G Gag-Pol polyprotein [Gossypium australe]|uniref:Transposon Ty3-G Gag-Pol polyprotein n=1 Tax=Gossypium australe TaxID=47621 RepID=A0A5B6VCZ1_9ROSI|nr:Transposon Ty3-G Gag-Pol polyprotein [Gossypium australe]